MLQWLTILIKRFFHLFRQMKKLEDDVYTFGFILLEAIVGSSVCTRRESFLLNEMVWIEFLTNCRMYINVYAQALYRKSQKLSKLADSYNFWNFGTILVDGFFPFLIHSWHQILHFAGIFEQPGRPETCNWPNCASHLLARILINCDFHNEQMHFSGIMQPSLYWGSPLEFTVCSSNSGNSSWWWSKTWHCIT